MVDLATQMDIGAAPTAKAVTTANFSAEVLQASARQPVLVHFLSARSEGCKGVQASLEKAVKAAPDKIKLVTMDIDAHPQIAQRLGVRAVPAVYAFQRGQPVDGFMGALPEPEIKGFIERLVGPLDDGSEEALAEAETALTGGDIQTAAAIFSALLDQDPAHLGATGGLARAFVAAGDLEGARGLLSQVPASSAKDKAIVAAQAALDLADQAGTVGDLAELQRKVEADPADHQARFDLAGALAGRGDFQGAVDHLLEIVARDRAWNDDGARKHLLTVFEAAGPMSDAAKSGRKRLSSLLFS